MARHTTPKLEDKPATVETPQVVITQTTSPSPKLSEQTLAEQAAGREALAKNAKK